jgi:hypothetical protein
MQISWLMGETGRGAHVRCDAKQLWSNDEGALPPDVAQRDSSRCCLHHHARNLQPGRSRGGAQVGACGHAGYRRRPRWRRPPRPHPGRNPSSSRVGIWLQAGHMCCAAGAEGADREQQKDPSPRPVAKVCSQHVARAPDSLALPFVFRIREETVFSSLLFLHVLWYCWRPGASS